MNAIDPQHTSPLRHPRVEVADVLRGLSVMGILLLHSIEHFNFYRFPDTAGQSALLNFTDRAIWDGLFFMIGGKAYAVFALLFGFSFFVQDYNRRQIGGDFRGRFCWRLVLLFLIGNINAAFFTGEILVLYSLVGFVLVLTCRLSTRTVLVIAGICLLQPWSLYCALRAALDPGYVVPMLQEGPLWAATMAEQSSGNFLSTALVNLWEGQKVSLAWAVNNGRVTQTAALFMLGMLIGRCGWFLPQRLGSWTRVGVVALVCFFPLKGLADMLPSHIANPQVLRQLMIVVGSLHKFAFMLVLVSGALWLYYRTSLKRVMTKIVPYGRMSLTNYVAQGVVGSFLFYNWGLGLYRYLGITASEALGVVLFLLQYGLSVWWMKRHAHGPLEYVWKRLTWIGLPPKSSK